MLQGLFLLPLSPPDSWQEIHPILVNFTAALIPTSIGSDLLGKVLRRQSFSHAAWWMLFYAALITPLTALTGWLWKSSLDVAAAPPADIIFLHQWIGSALAVAFIVLAIWRGQIHRRGEAPNVAYFLLASVVLVLLIYQGSLGGMMVFGS
jgi:uncharacterized membrane protein